MTSGEIVITVFIGFVSAGLGSLFWARLNRLEGRVDGLHSDVGSLRGEVGSQIGSLRGEVQSQIGSLGGSIESLSGKVEGLGGRVEDLSREVAGLRSDLTQVALAVGARGPRASEG